MKEVKRLNRKISVPVLLIMTLVALAFLASHAINMARQAEAAVTIYETGQGYDETRLSAWMRNGVPSRGITSGVDMQIGTFVFDSSYPTGGEAFDLSDSFKNAVLFVTFYPKQVSTTLYNFEYVPAAAGAPATGTVRAFVSSTGVEAGNGGDMSGATAIGYQAWGW